MLASKALVYIPDLNKHTWLLMTRRKDSVCLRDYFPADGSAPKEDRTRNRSDIERLLKNGDSHYESLSTFTEVGYQDIDFWRDQIELRNAELHPEEEAPTRLSQRFATEFKKASSQASCNEAIRTMFERWSGRFERTIVSKQDFNHWDRDSPTEYFSNGRGGRTYEDLLRVTGIGWTSQLLEYSRGNSVCTYVRTGIEEADFSLLAMELSLGISSRNNLFREGQRDFIKPDGLAVRADGSMTVLEVKGPQDDPSLTNPVVQATCAALAVVAKRHMITRIATAADGDSLKPRRRPVIANARIPLRRRSLGIHVLSHAEKAGQPRQRWSDQVEGTCRSILANFAQLKYIAFSFVSAAQAESLGNKLRTDILVTPDSIWQR
ncbi:hypothetical protein [Candidatus Laterigemmans baculatus]|uniref:hypothetical protein n=1 Tax=Candidatus Laterigemmans baculatus TaxID=2770505 RepID=UPI0013D97209|nr:hypothetical protein [Candidatus Laterigemmans baculatus]